MKNLIYAIPALGLAVGAFAPYRFAGAGKQINPNDAIMSSIPWRMKENWKDPLSYPFSEYFCMAEAIYFEARGESEIGQAAVAHVILNRTRSQGFPRDVCGVVKQQNGKVFQFSYRANPITYADAAKKRLAEKIAVRVLEKRIPDMTHGSLFYLNPTTADNPAFHNRLMAQGYAHTDIGRHRFVHKALQGKAFAEYMNNRAAPVQK